MPKPVIVQPTQRIHRLIARPRWRLEHALGIQRRVSELDEDRKMDDGLGLAEVYFDGGMLHEGFVVESYQVSCKVKRKGNGLRLGGVLAWCSGIRNGTGDLLDGRMGDAWTHGQEEGQARRSHKPATNQCERH